MNLSDAQHLRNWFDYDPDSGIVRWKRKPRYGISVGDQVKTAGAGGYLTARLRGLGTMKLHRMIWCWMTGEWPAREMQIDHIDCDRLNNRWSNLRLATNGQNQANSPAYRSNKLGVKGVHAASYKGKIRYRAQIQKDGITRMLGSFKTIEEASRAYAQASRDSFGEYARTA